MKKAVSWALRQIGKRSAGLNTKAIRTAEQIERIDARASRWIARDALPRAPERRGPGSPADALT